MNVIRTVRRWLAAAWYSQEVPRTTTLLIRDDRTRTTRHEPPEVADDVAAGEDKAS